MSVVMDPWEAHKHLRKHLGTEFAGAAFLDMVCAFDPRHEFSAKGMVRAINEICYQDFDTYPQGHIYPTPQDGAPMASIEPFVQGALTSLQAIATLYDTSEYKPLVPVNTAKAYVEVIKSTWTNMGAAPNVSA